MLAQITSIENPRIRSVFGEAPQVDFEYVFHHQLLGSREPSRDRAIWGGSDSTAKIRATSGPIRTRPPGSPALTPYARPDLGLYTNHDVYYHLQNV